MTTPLNGLSEAASRATQQIGEQMTAYWRSIGITPPSERPYLGSRCGWYPAKPKRRKARM